MKWISLTDEQVAVLEPKAEALGITLEELVRRIIASAIERYGE